jgi:hypothetical protein
MLQLRHRTILSLFSMHDQFRPAKFFSKHQMPDFMIGSERNFFHQIFDRIIEVHFYLVFKVR